jgi:diphthine synthase
MLYLIGLGLGDVEDISIKGLEVVKNAKEVYLEAYTSILTVGKDALVRYQELAQAVERGLGRGQT